MRIGDRILTWLENTPRLMERILHKYFPDHPLDKEHVVKCPFHSDTKASLSISPRGKAHCFGCGWSASNVIDLVAKLENVPYNTARETLRKYLGASPTKSTAHVEALAKRLRSHKEAMKYLLEKRGISPEVIQERKLGYSDTHKRIAIPIFDQFGMCVNMRLASMSSSNGPKMINTKGMGTCRLYPEDLMVNENVFLLVEGEFDALVGRSLGIPAVTWTAGANSWNKDHEWLFRNKSVFILYDNDAAGQQGAKSAEMRLAGVAAYVEIVDPLCDRGKDLSDWAKLDKTKVHFLATDLANFQPPVEMYKVCPTCGRPM